LEEHKAALNGQNPIKLMDLGQVGKEKMRSLSARRVADISPESAAQPSHGGGIGLDGSRDQIDLILLVGIKIASSLGPISQVLNHTIIN
jgi:hypothetical protein